MPITFTPWTEAPEDHPIPLLHRRMVKGKQALVAKIHLEKGCKVNLHSHESEQIAVITRGKLLWHVDGQDQVLEGGNVLVLHSHVPHAVEALEDSEVLDILSPIGPMGVDSQK